MTIESVMSHSKTFYDAAIIESASMNLIVVERIIVVSATPITLTVKSMDALDAKLKEQPDGWGATVYDMLKAGGMAYAITVESDTPIYRIQGHSLIGTAEADASDLLECSAYKKMVVMSKHDHAGDLSGWLPVEIFRKFGGKDKIESEPKDEVFLLEEAKRRIDKAVANEKEFGRTEKNSNILSSAEHMKGAVSRVEELGKVLLNKGTGTGDRPTDGMTPETAFDGNTMRYVPAKLTQFVDGGMGMEGKPYRPFEKLRITHLDDPVWHEADDDAKAAGYIGFWEFDVAGVGAVRSIDVKDDERKTEVLFEYTGYKNLRVGIKGMAAITPRGEMAIPQVVWEALADGRDREMPESMSHDECAAFDREHTLPDDYVTSSNVMAKAN